ncbi:MAG TPA: hypothetical protein VHS96_12120, partial [Bacteroidia bacterium]|nr:hypothetical protein [Bacteroidia bacterium]
MHKTLVLLGCLLAMLGPADAIGQAPASSLDTATHPANSFRANAIRNPDSMALVALGGWDGNLVCGLHGTPGQGFHTTFMDSMPLSRETDVARAIGAVDYDAQYKVFRFGPVAKLNGDDYRGTVCSFNAYEDLTTVSGRVDFPTHFKDKTISMALAGAWEENHRRKRVECDFVGGFDLGCIPKKAWEKLAKMALIATAMNPDLDWESEVFLHGLA